ncbi:hypothetical protein [Candidatus Nitrotoga arctica]|uniref:hypothetical protein n=1 Tax=Candidatus Nitrotoga arctica TaxID=453162 RepID=UPI001EFBDFC3|nr:hypothetical protein [Candidatus Nitrotoga arctica]
MKLFRTTLKRTVESFVLQVDQDTTPLGVINALGNIANLKTDLKTCLGCGRIFAQVRTMNFQLQTFGTLAEGHEFRLRECAHDLCVGRVKNKCHYCSVCVILCRVRIALSWPQIDVGLDAVQLACSGSTYRPGVLRFA